MSAMYSQRGQAEFCAGVRYVSDETQGWQTRWGLRRCCCFATQALSTSSATQWMAAMDELFAADGESGFPSQVRTPGCFW
jgi:hypothetical protein